MWAQAFWDDSIWIDVILFGAISLFHCVAWSTPPTRQDDPSPISGAVTGGITAVGILIPATLVALQLAKPTNPSTLAQFLYADIWFTLSLFFGLYILYTIGVKSRTQDVFTRRDVGYAYGLQLFALFVGSIRLLVGIAILFAGG